jgi:hypothetical protein
MVIASTLVTVLIIVGIVVVVGVAFVALGPLSGREQLRDDIDAGTLLGGDLPEEAREEWRRQEGLTDERDEERLDRENE